ncbi:MAG: HD domain-containing protein [Spirochaetes bacterium]|jgi:uncharacterized protein|nr:HD domain-containing protein [Spirochaetota bacterium]
MDLEQKYLLEKTMAFVREKMKKLPPSHGIDHVERVLRLSEKIAAAENGDIFIVRLSAMLHDIAREEEDKSGGNLCHAELGSVIARDFLLSENLDSETADRVAKCIITHRYRNDHIPVTIEEKVLYDADKLDSIGAIGIGRAFLFAGEVGARLHNPDIDISKTLPYTIEDTAYREYIVKMRHLEKKMLTAEGKKLAGGRHEFMVEFFRRLQDEYDGSV